MTNKIKNLKTISVRLTPFVLLLFWIYDIYKAFMGVEISPYLYNTFGVSLFTLIPLWIVSECDSKIHCLYMRILYAAMIIAEIINIIDFKYQIISDCNTFIFVMVGIFALSFLLIIYFSIRHFGYVK